MITSLGRATPLMWKSHDKFALKKLRNEYEDDLPARLCDTIPEGVRVTVLADRGFGDQALYAALLEAKIDFGIRFRGAISFTDDSTSAASSLVPPNGRAKKYLLVGALAQALLTLLGAAAEEVGLDRQLKANTVKRRTTSLFNQGWYWYGAIANMR